jgi:acetylornithine deacetylase/succinyl-diaminopimelate desuccinylase-like protein
VQSPEERKRRHRNERIVAVLLVLVVGAATAFFVRQSQRADEEFRRQTTYVPKQTPLTKEVLQLQEYIRFDTSNPPGDELPAAQWLAGRIRAAGVAAEVIESAPGRGNVYARIEGKRKGTGLLLLHHIDVAPADPEGWRHTPFSGDIRLDQLHGRGAIDMKGMGVVFLRAFLDIAQNAEVPEHDVVFLAVADEEAGSRWGMEWLVRHRPDTLAGIRYALNEGGITEMMEERVTYYGIEIGTKVQVALQVIAPTREQLQRVRIALEPYFTPDREPHRILPEVREFFKDIAPQRIEFADDLADVDKTIASGKFWDLPIGYRELTQNNVFAQGIVPRAEGGFQMRTMLMNLPDEDPDRRIAWLAGKIQPFGARIGDVERKEGPVPMASSKTPFFEFLKSEASKAFGCPAGTEILNRSWNDSRFLRHRGIEAYGINPFPIDFFQAESIHGKNESVRIDYFVRGVEFTRGMVWRYAYGSDRNRQAGG